MVCFGKTASQVQAVYIRLDSITLTCLCSFIGLSKLCLAPYPVWNGAFDVFSSKLERK